jgi:hypothetical protein
VWRMKGIARAATCSILVVMTATSSYFFWAAALCEREDVDLVERPLPTSLAGPVTFSADLEIPFSAVPPRFTLFQRFAARNHPSRILRPLNTWFHGGARYGIPAPIPWVRLTVRGLLALSCLLTALLATRLGWLTWQFSLRAMFIFITLSAVGIWAHGQLKEWQQLQPNRDLAWAVGLAAIGMAAGFGAGIRGPRATKGKQPQASASDTLPNGETLNCLVARITPQNVHAEVDFGPPVGNEIW